MKILFFTPHAALWAHTAPEAFLAKALAERGHEVQYLTCGRAQTYCAPMTARRLAPSCMNSTESKKTCQFCVTAAKSIAKTFNFSMYTLAQYMEQGDYVACAAIANAAVQNKTLDTIFHGVTVGRIALYEFTLMHKKMSMDLTDAQWKEYEVYLYNCLVTLLAFSRYLETSTPDVISAFSPQYSNINSCLQLAIRRGIKVLFMESGTNLSHRLGTMRVWDWKVHKLVNPALSYWEESACNLVSQEAADLVVQHFQQLLSGQHFAVFSSPYVGNMNIRHRWSIKPEQKVLLLTLSSYDEAYAALLIDAFPYDKVFSDVFKTQAEWLKATIEWVKQRPDLFLVVRVHPRDFPNKREQVRSEQSFMLEELLQNVPLNVHINWPEEGVSLYELFEETDVLLTGWSVTAIEALVLGLPVVTYDEKLPSYPRDIMSTGRSAEEYYANIDKELIQGWRIENVVNGFRWLAYNFMDCTVVVSKSFGRHELPDRSLCKRLWARLMNRFSFIGFRLDLLKWRDAINGAEIVDCMLVNNFDAIPVARKALKLKSVQKDDREIISKALQHLYNLLYKHNIPSVEKPGLACHIRHYLENRL